ncbi:MAG: Spy/CpxP family protein refolding chaperone [Chloroflexi bacterium]|nr:Spy/CpxP family protein refolding chaperone [Chloroflexota bacterium]
MSKRFLVSVSIVVILGVIGVALLLHLGFPEQSAQSPYVAQLNSPVRGLSAQEVDDLLNGRGTGFARTAELNNYPGPRHVLDLQQELNLSPEQVTHIEGIFQQMRAEAKRIGQEIVQRESQFSTAFANQIITEAGLQAQTEALAQLYGRLRATHLQAHLQITLLLSAEQIAQYNSLRGYTNAPGQLNSGLHQHQGH